MLFEMVPEVKPLFKRKLSSQGRMLANVRARSRQFVLLFPVVQLTVGPVLLAGGEVHCDERARGERRRVHDLAADPCCGAQRAGYPRQTRESESLRLHCALLWHWSLLKRVLSRVQYSVMGECLLHAIRVCTGPESYTTAVHTAWSVACGISASALLPC